MLWRVKIFIRKPFATLVVVIFVAAAILYIESTKPKIEASSQQQNIQLQKNSLKNQNLQNNPASGELQKIIEEKNQKYPAAPDFVGIDKWINSEPLTMEQLKGKVVLVDIWTYTCINCIRTLPYLKEWYKKYQDKGFVIIGVHSPEFEFEKKYENVLKAVNDYQIKYPVALDNNHATWSVYQNRYWPHKFLIDIDGYIRYDHIGEGNYDETEKMIQSLLEERMERLNKINKINQSISKPKEVVEFDYTKIGTPEIYFGYEFTRGNIGYDNMKPEEIADYKIPPSPLKNYVYLSGKWKNNADNIELISNEGSILLGFHAKNVNIVAGSENQSKAFVFLDNKNESVSTVKEFKLYNLANAENYDNHEIKIDIKGKGFKIYTFTFG